MNGLWLWLILTNTTPSSVNSARARFVAQNPSDTFIVSVTQNGRTQTCSTDALNPRTCELTVDVGEAEISVSGSQRFSFKHTYAEGLSIHRLKWRSRWPLYLGGAFVGVGIGAVGAGVSFALRCANGTPIEKITACGGPAEVGYVLGGIFASLGITGIIVGAATTGNRTVTDHEQLGQAADFLRFVPQLAFEFGKQGTIAQAQWSF